MNPFGTSPEVPAGRPGPARSRHPRRLLSQPAVADSLISVAGLVGCPLLAADEGQVGRVVDVVGGRDGTSYPLVKGLVARVGFRRVFVPVGQLGRLSPAKATLATGRLDVTEYARREGDTLLT